jgi:CreA protein
MGFDLICHADEAGWSEITTNTDHVTIGLGEHVEPVLGNCVPVFEISDIDDARQKKEHFGIKFDGDTIVVEGMVKTATFYDTDGNALMLAQDLSDTPH